MTEDDVCQALMRDRLHQSFMIPRFSPAKWWECDVFEVTRAGYFREFEVKLTLADFRRDAAKCDEFRLKWDAPAESRNKHELLMRGDPRGPVEFWFVAPEGMIAETELPHFTGLIAVKDHGADHESNWRYTLRTVRDAPRLHNTKIDDSIRRHALGVCYARYHAVMSALRHRKLVSIAELEQLPPELP